MSEHIAKLTLALLVSTVYTLVNIVGREFGALERTKRV